MDTSLLNPSPQQDLKIALTQYFPQAEVDAIWEAIATHVSGQQEPSEGGADNDGQKNQNKKKKKRKKSR